MKRASFIFETLSVLAISAGIVLWSGQALALWTFSFPHWLVPALLLLAVALLLSALLCRRKYAHMLESELAELAELETHIAARSALHAEVLEQMKETSSKDLEHFRSDLAHGLRMPIAIVQGYAELLHGDLVSDPAVQKDYLQKIIQRTRYMSEVLSKQFASLSALSGTAPNYQSLDLMELVRQVADDLQNAATGQGIAIQIVSTEDTVPMEADGYQLNRVFFNLVENAIKYMGRDGVITIRITRSGNEVSIMVKDDGLGLPSEETARIFDLEFQGSNSADGSGHGLYLVRSTVEAHGGTVSAESAPGRGMGIFITIPTQPLSSQAEQSAQ